MDVNAFPQIRYTGHRLTALRPDTWHLDGRLTLKSVAQPVALNIDYLDTGPGPLGDVRAGFHASTQLDRDEFGRSGRLGEQPIAFCTGSTRSATP
ncbi:MAG: hypothetical protein DLM61_23675 [Pseudonocardiales bacterium]|nr:MAG: hypothetical protein DLM61_23675 [Pseudonocardiales bacterium]